MTVEQERINRGACWCGVPLGDKLKLAGFHPTCGELASQWQERTNTDRLKRVQRKGYKAYKCLNGDHEGDVVKFRLEGVNYVFDSIEER